MKRPPNPEFKLDDLSGLSKGCLITLDMRYPYVVDLKPYQARELARWLMAHVKRIENREAKL